MPDYEFGELRNFVYVAEARSFTEAARRAHLSTPAISKSIKRLENKLEATLFERTSRRVELTIAGQALLVHARTVLDAVAAFGHALDRPEGQICGPLAVGITDAIDTRILAPALTSLVAAHPHCVPEVRRVAPSAIASELRGGRLDIAVYFGPELPVDGAYHESLGLGAFTLLGRAGAIEAARTPTETRGESTLPPIVVPNEFELASRQCDELGRFDIGMRVDSVELALEVAAHGAMLALVPALWADRAAASHGLHKLGPTVGTRVRLGMTSLGRGLAPRALRNALIATLEGRNTLDFAA